MTSPQSPAAQMIAAKLKELGLFFESLSCGWVDAETRIKMLRDEDALELACFFSQIGWQVEVEGRVVRARVGAA
jgi:hypothetical protein